MEEKKSSQLKLMVLALGVVYGDIGTSPLYTLQTCFNIGKLPISQANILGISSILIWTLFIIVSIKYVTFVLKADYHGEGGILTLASMCAKFSPDGYKSIPIFLGILGAALFFGDGIITPAISILSAVEGLNLVSHTIGEHSVGITIGLIILLFLSQKNGSERIGRFFGPVMIVWFLVIGALGICSIFKTPSILYALNPYYAASFIYENIFIGLMVLGGTILVITGAEALYADIGHFGKRPITLSWNFFVFPMLLLNYLGQGGLLLRSPEAITNPFYLLASSELLYPLIFLSTIATIIASQSVITGVFSLGAQAIMLNYLPKMRVIHTSSHQQGQVYIPAINYTLCILIILVILKFKTSTHLATAYGLSVAGVMLLTTILVSIVASRKWNWNKYQVTAFLIPLFLLDSIYLIANSNKIMEGAWLTILATLIVSGLILIWRRGETAIHMQEDPFQKNLDPYITAYEKEWPQKIPGTAIFMGPYQNKVPNSLLIHLKYNKFLHEKIIFISVLMEPVPFVPEEEKHSSIVLHGSYSSVTATYGFNETPNIHDVIAWLKDKEIVTSNEELSIFLSRRVPVPPQKNFIKYFSQNIYVFLARNSLASYEFYRVPDDKVLELGVRHRV